VIHEGIQKGEDFHVKNGHFTIIEPVNMGIST
jgi:hypothetical protein